MPDVKPADYTTGELTSAANVCRDAVALLTPTADELMRISAEVELPDEELHFARTSRHVSAAALHLKISETTIRRITENAGRTYGSVKTRLLGLSVCGWTVATVIFGLCLILPRHIAQILQPYARYPLGFAIGVSIAGWIVERGFARPPRDP